MVIVFCLVNICDSFRCSHRERNGKMFLILLISVTALKVATENGMVSVFYFVDIGDSSRYIATENGIVSVFYFVDIGDSSRCSRREWNCNILAHLSWKLEWAFLITCRLVCLSVCLSVRLSARLSVNFSHFSSSSPEPLSQFQPILAQASLDDRDSCFFKRRSK